MGFSKQETFKGGLPLPNSAPSCIFLLLSLEILAWANHALLPRSDDIGWPGDLNGLKPSKTKGLCKEQEEVGEIALALLCTYRASKGRLLVMLERNNRLQPTSCSFF